MKGNRNIRKLIILLGLTALAFFLFFVFQEKSTPTVDPSLFRVGDMKQIDKVELIRGGVPVSLKFADGHWKVNDTYEADRQRITILFATLAQAVPKRPVATSRHDTVALQLKEKGVTVKLYQGATLVKEFIAGGNLARSESYFSDAADSKAYLMMIPGYRVYVSQIFELDENEWRDRRIFSIRWEHLQSLQVTYPSDPKSGFEIAKVENVFSVVGEPKADTTRVFNFLDDVSLLVADHVRPLSSQAYDSLSKIKPVVSVLVRDNSNRTFSLSLFQPKPGDAMVPGLTDGQTMVLFDPKRLFKIAKKRSYFTQPTSPSPR